ncbi:staygreen family protein [Paenibacillus sp. CC-CFT747]|nr:staygreen family protein [Paenibacillus sp. CC-CFT747]
MTPFNPDRLIVEFRPGMYPTQPQMNRKYTLTHSDETGELFLTLGPEYAFDKITGKRDEVLAEWRYAGGLYRFEVYVYLGGPDNPALAEKRYEIFKRELPLALEAIRYGDRIFFEAHPALDDTEVIVHFQADPPLAGRTESFGPVKRFKTPVTS